MTYEEYEALDAVRASNLKEMRRSPLHYRHRCQVPREDKKSFWMGRGAHCAVLEPDELPLRYAVWRGGDRRGNEYKAFAAANADKTILREDEYEACLAMRDAVRAHPVASRLVANGKAEYTIVWTDEETGLLCKGRLDFLREPDPVLVDMKTGRDGEPRAFGNTAARLGYPLQFAFYRAGLAANGLCEVPVKIVMVEAEAPHDVQVFSVDDDALWYAEQEMHTLLRRVAECRAKNEWPGRCSTETPLQLPGWFFGPAEESNDVLAGLMPAAQEA